jgi:hypothetical protein
VQHHRGDRDGAGGNEGEQERADEFGDEAILNGGDDRSDGLAGLALLL